MLAPISRAEMSALARIANSLGPTAPPAVCRVRLRTLARAGGTTERWRQPRLAPWEVPRRDPAEPRPNAPDVARSDGRHDSDGGRVSAPVMRDLMRGCRQRMRLPP